MRGRLYAFIAGLLLGLHVMLWTLVHAKEDDWASIRNTIERKRAERHRPTVDDLRARASGN